MADKEKNQKDAKGILDLYQKKVFDAKAVAEYMQNHPEVAVEMVIEMARRNQEGQITDEEAMKLMREYETLQKKQDQPDVPQDKNGRIRLDFSDGNDIVPPASPTVVKPPKTIT